MVISIKKIWKWILWILTILALLRIIECYRSHDHFVSSGNLFFQGSAPGALTIDKYGWHGYNYSHNCFDPASCLAIEHNLYVPVPCPKIQTRVDFDPVLGSVGITRLKVYFFNDGILNQQNEISKELFMVDNAGVEYLLPSSEEAFVKDQPTYTDYFYSSTLNTCVAHLRLKVKINANLSAGNNLHVVAYIDSHDNLHKHDGVYPLCISDLQQNGDSTQVGLRTIPADIDSSGQVQRSLFTSGCQIYPDTTLAYYQCLEDQQCHSMDHTLIFQLPPVCNPMSF